jgi:drug/metabolite transporter (DMT)-like permease
MRLMLMRLCVGYPGWLMLTYSVAVIPLGLAQTLQNLIPFMVVIISYKTLKEKLKPLELVNMVVSFTAVIFIVSLSNN